MLRQFIGRLKAAKRGRALASFFSLVLRLISFNGLTDRELLKNDQRAAPRLTWLESKFACSTQKRRGDDNSGAENEIHRGERNSIGIRSRGVHVDLAAPLLLLATMVALDFNYLSGELVRVFDFSFTRHRCNCKVAAKVAARRDE